MDDTTLKELTSDPSGMLTYEYMVNHIYDSPDCLDFLVETIKSADKTGQFTASSAIYLTAVDSVRFASHVSNLVKATIERDRERKYLTPLAAAIWGTDFRDKADALMSDDNFRRIYKRLHPEGPI